MFKMRVLGTMAAFLLVVAQAGIRPACLFWFYQPELPE